MSTSHRHRQQIRVIADVAARQHAHDLTARANEQSQLDASLGADAPQLGNHPDGEHRHAEIFGDLIDAPFVPNPIVNSVTVTVSRADALLCQLTLDMLAREGRPGADWMERVAKAMREAIG